MDPARLWFSLEILLLFFPSYILYGSYDGRIALNVMQRRHTKVSTGDQISVISFFPPAGFSLALLTLELDYVKAKANRNDELDAVDLAQHILKKFNNQIINQREAASSNIFKQKEFDLQKLGIGGVSEDFFQIFRRAFASRVYPPHVTKKLGIKYVKGMLLYGPPGTGKTLMARQIEKLLDGRERKIVNGPEVLSKYIEESEKNVRDLFADAEQDQRTHGDQSDLHVIIFDEIDAICKARGSTQDGTGVHDGIVNQLLTKIDGVESLNNILLIGMTNRKDLIDEALLSCKDKEFLWG